MSLVELHSAVMRKRAQRGEKRYPKYFIPNNGVDEVHRELRHRLGDMGRC